MADLSIIIPTFDRLWSLPKAVESCRAIQLPTEIIVIDDGSTDGTWEWLQAQSDVIALRQDNWGKDWAVNRGLAHATADYIRFLDSDDWLDPGACEEQIEIAKRTGADVVVAGFYLYDENTLALEEHRWVGCDDFIAQQLGECSSGHYSAYLLRRSFIADIPHRQEFGLRDDRMFTIELAGKHPTVQCAVHSSLYHRKHGRARLQDPDPKHSLAANRQLFGVYRKAIDWLERRNELTPRRIRAATNILWPLAHRLAGADLDEGCDIAAWVYRLDPKFRPPESGLLGWLYRTVGFRGTERLLNARRALIGAVRG